MEQSQLRFGKETLHTGVTLHYAERVGPHGEPVVLLPGLSDSWFSYSRVLPLLPPHRYLYALSPRGHGDSERPGSGCDVATFAADALAFMDARGLAEAALVGHLPGSFVAQRVALEQPERAARLVLVESAATALNEGTAALGEVFGTLTDPVPPEFVREFQASTVYHPVLGAFFETVVAESLKLPARVWRDTRAGFAGADHTARLASLEVPTLIVWGDRDGVFTRESLEHLAAALP